MTAADLAMTLYVMFVSIVSLSVGFYLGSDR